MTLTVCVGASGSGKTTFLNDVYKSHKCTYIRQYHNLRPYISVSKIPNFDPTKLPYWDTYVREKKAKSIIVGGTIAGQFMPGLSGGQRKLLLFELICQRTASQNNLLIVLDEPFAGVTDDFVPFIVGRLNEMRITHNILLVTNDHVDTLKKMADNTVTVSAIDRTTVKINEHDASRDLALLAMSIGDEYKQPANNNDFKFFLDVEFSMNGGIPGVAGFTIIAFALFVATFWGSKEGSEALVMVASGLIAFFSINPYLLQLVDWRIYMIEEAEALLHSSKTMNNIMKSILTLTMIVVIALIQYGVVNICMSVNSLSGPEFFFGILFDNAALMFPFVCLGLYTNVTFQAVQILASFPFLLMIFFSTTFSPGAGIEGLKSLRYLFSRFYLWCMIPGVQDQMEECPENNTLLYLILSSFIFVFIFLTFLTVRKLTRKLAKNKQAMERMEKRGTVAFVELQVELFGDKALRKLQHLSAKDLKSLGSNSNVASTMTGSNEGEEKKADDSEDQV